MKKLLMLGLLAGLLASSLVGRAGAVGKTTTLFLQGKEPLKPVQEAHVPEAHLDDIWMTMGEKKPTDDLPASMFVTNYVFGPNTECDGNELLPVWKGDFSTLPGTFSGDIKVTLHTVATPVAPMVVSLYADPTGTCSGGGAPGMEETKAPKPVAQGRARVPAGAGVTTVTFKDVRFKAFDYLALQLHIGSFRPGQVRVLFDSVEFPSNVSLTEE